MLFAIASKLSDEGRNKCAVAVWTGYAPKPLSLSKASINFECGVYQVTLLRNEFEGDNGQQAVGYLVLESFGTRMTTAPVPPSHP
jgi:hypothetical protein